MHTFNILVLVSLPLWAFAQQDVGQCALSCARSATEILDAACNVEEWSCLCGNPAYVDRFAKCVKTNCTSIEYDVTVMAIPEICEAIRTMSGSETATNFPKTTSELLYSTTLMSSTSVTDALCTTDGHHPSVTTPKTTTTTSASSYASVLPQITPSDPTFSAPRSVTSLTNGLSGTGMTTKAAPTDNMMANIASQAVDVRKVLATSSLVAVLMIALSI